MSGGSPNNSAHRIVSDVYRQLGLRARRLSSLVTARRLHEKMPRSKSLTIQVGSLERLKHCFLNFDTDLSNASSSEYEFLLSLEFLSQVASADLVVSGPSSSSLGRTYSILTRLQIVHQSAGCVVFSYRECRGLNYHRNADDDHTHA